MARCSRAERSSSRQRAFTLLEVLVALVIIGVALAASMRGALSLTTAAEDTRYTMLATMVAENRLLELRLARGSLEIGQTTTPCAQANVEFECEQTARSTPNPGRDKLTLVAHPALAPLGAWLEQLVAESTGKDGRAVLPFEGEPLAAAQAYGGDRLFVPLRLRGAPGEGDEARLDALVAAGHPVAEIDVASPLDLGAEFYRWEFATAVAGAELGVHPFDQPDVESAKLEARRLAEEVERTGALPVEVPFWTDDGCALFAPEEQAKVILAGAGRRPGPDPHRAG